MSSLARQIGFTETGEIICERCTERIAALGEADTMLGQRDAVIKKSEVEIAGLQHEIRSLAHKLEEAKRDREAEAREHDLFDQAMDLFDLWRRAAAEAEGKKHKRNKFSGERFWLVLPFLKGEAALCQRAIIGRCFDHYGADGKLRRANGSAIHYCEFERIFKDRKEFEESVKRCPADWRERVRRFGFEVAE